MSTYILLRELTKSYKENGSWTFFIAFSVLGFTVKLLQVANFVIMVFSIIVVLGKTHLSFAGFVPNMDDLVFLSLMLIFVNIFSFVITVIKNHFFVLFYNKSIISGEQHTNNQMSKYLAIMKVFAKFLQACLFVTSALLCLIYLAPTIGAIALVALLILLWTRQFLNFSNISKFKKLVFIKIRFLDLTLISPQVQKDINTDINIITDNVVASVLFVFSIIVFDTLNISFNNLGSVLILVFCIRYIVTYSIDAVRSLRKLKSLHHA